MRRFYDDWCSTDWLIFFLGAGFFTSVICCGIARIICACKK